MTGYFRKIIRIRGEDSPNVKYAREQQAAGLTPTNHVVLPGVLPWADYQKRRATWDAIRQSIGLDAEFYEGAELLLFPAQWRQRAEQHWNSLRVKRRTARGVGVDPAEGGDRTALAACDEDGVIEVQSLRTPDTNRIPELVAAFVVRHGCPWERVVVDRGGGGKQLADRLRGQGRMVRTVGFGEQISQELKRGVMRFTEKLDVREEKYAYVNRRAQLYGVLSELLDPDNPRAFSLPPASLNESAERLHKALSVVPRLYDPEDRLFLPPKNRKPGSKEKTGMKPLVELIGFSPDESDAVVLSVDGYLGGIQQNVAGAAV